MRGLIVDNFAGGGGASTGIEMAIGRSVDIAINHDPDAIAMHSANHPNTLHYCESVFDVDPVQATAGRPVDLCWLSPDCKHFSKAKGGKPVNKEIRGLAWIGVRWALLVRPKVLMLENVEEFKTWGPVVVDLEGRAYPCPERKGETFAAFVAILSTGIAPDHPGLAECCDVLGIDDPAPLIKGLGYKVEYKELRACDYGAPTIRKRLFMVARCDGRPVVWPEPTHGAPNSADVKSGKLLPYRTAAECIDFTRPCHSIFERKKPLAENTLSRIAKGIQRFVIEAAEPFIVTCNHSGENFRGQGLNEPFKTILASRDAHGLVQPVLTPFITEHANASNQRNMPADSPLRTLCAEVKGGHFAVVNPVLAPFTIGVGGPKYSAKPKSVEQPFNTVVTTAHSYVIAPVIARQFGGSVGHAADAPLGTVTAGGGGKSQLVSAFMTKYYGEKSVTERRGVGMDEPLHTVTTENRFGVVAVNLCKHFGGNYSGPGAPVTDPLPTVTTVDHTALVTSHLLKLRNNNYGSSNYEPVPTVTAGGNHLGEVRAFLLKYYGNEKDGAELTEPMHTITGRDRFGLVMIKGEPWQIVDIGMRMLEPDELFLAQSFPANYIIDKDAKGKKLSKAVQVARCGNAVPPAFAEALTRANLPELCTSKQEQAA